MLDALKRAWDRMIAEDSRVPHVLIDLTPGRPSGCASVGWLNEVRVLQVNLRSGDQNRSAAEVMGWLMHQAAHGIVGPVPGQEGRAHGSAYRSAAAAIGLEADGGITGSGSTRLSRGSLTRYRNEISALDRALARWNPTPHVKAARNSRNPVLAACPCGRKIRVQKSTLEDDAIICGKCGGTFEAVLATNPELDTSAVRPADS